MARWFVGARPVVSMKTRSYFAYLVIKSFSSLAEEATDRETPIISQNVRNCSTAPIRKVSKDIIATFFFFQWQYNPANLAIVVVFPEPVGPTKAEKRARACLTGTISTARSANFSGSKG